jgi:two-component system sensor histidine kinase YesM
MILTYASFVTVVAVILGTWYNAYSFKQYKDNEYRNLELLAEQLSDQFDENVKPMKLITNYLLSDMDVLDALRTLSIDNSSSEIKLRYIEEARSIIRSQIYSDYMMNNFYRVIVFNQQGYVIANDNYAAKVIDPKKNINDLKWLGKLVNKKGTPVLIGPHTDEWGLLDNPEVFSIVKQIQGSNMGYIEIQKKTSSLDSLFEIPKEGVRVVVVTEGQEILYKSQDDVQSTYYLELAKQSSNGITQTKNPYTQDDEIVSIHHSGESDTTVLVIEDVKVMMKEASYITTMTIQIASIFFIISLIFVFIVSGHLTKPIRELRAFMENTHIENLEEKMSFNSTNDEFEALNKSYQRVLDRLNEAIVKEKRMSLLQLQAQFDLLQAQVNPHFFYNVLNVISHKGVISGDESICEICDSLAAMLRYSTNTKNRYATMAEEIDYLERYFYLLKSRYAHKIQCTIDVPLEIQSQIIPKILFQQVVENSVNHGFENSTDVMKIEIRGWTEDVRWYVAVRDNGQGFEEDAIIKLKNKMHDVREKLTTERNSVELEIGGMGIINMYARLLLLYENDLTFELVNEEKGASVIIGAPMEKVKEVNSNVYGCCS